MEEIFSHMDGRFEVTLTDSTMMWIVHCAMNKAQEKMKTKKGVIERLNEISKFYELAVMQLEGCLSFVHAETESSFLESNHEEVLADLREIKDRLQGRLKESEMAISKKDRELTERLENELKLRQALEMKERELVSLGVNTELEKPRGANFENDEGRRRNEDSDGDFSELKIKERLEPHNGIDIEKVEEIGSDIDILKQTMDIAFGKIQSALFFAEMGPKVQQWKLTAEKDIMSTLVKSYMREFQENIEAEVRKQENQVLKCWWEHWSQLMKEVKSLRHELGPFISQNELQGTYSEESNSSPLSLQQNFWQKFSQELVGRSASEESSHDKSKRSSSPKIEEVDKMGKLAKEEDNKDGSNFVSKMVKNHESIIRQKSQELNVSKCGIVLDKKASFSKKEKEPDSLKERIQNVTARLDNLINWNAKVSESLFDRRAVHEEEAPPERKLSEVEIGEVKNDECTLESAWEKMKKVSDVAKEMQDDIRGLNKEKEDKISSENTYLDKGLVEEFNSKSFNFEIEKQIQEGVCKYYLKEVINEWNEYIERNSIESHIRNKVYFTVFSEAAKDISSAQDFVLAKSQGGETEGHCSNNVDEIEGTIRGDVSMLIFKEMVEEYNKVLEDCNAENQVKEEINQIIFAQTVKNIARTVNSASREYREDNIQDHILDQLQLICTESLLKEDVCMVVFRGMLKEWNMELENYFLENHIREQLHQFIMFETLKDVIISSMEVKSPVQDSNPMEDTLSITMLNQVHEVQGEGKLIKILLESLLTCLEAEENLMLSAKSEIKEHSRQLDLGSDREDLHEHEIFEDLLIGEEQTFCSLTSKVENALEQLGVSKALLSELGTTLGLRLCNSEKIRSRKTTKEEGQLKPSSPAFFPLLNFLQTFTEFEGMLNQKLEIETVRLENMKHCLDPVIKLVDCLRSKESIFQKAFIRRCQNLRKAELEVDLLGDQVDALLTLLEKIYLSLHQYAPALQQYFEVFDILGLIKKELRTVQAASVVT